jgi:hypothetical protein
MIRYFGKILRLDVSPWVAVIFCLVAGIPKTVFASSISINTAALSGTPGRLDFQLFDGDLVANNSATISGLVTNGTFQGRDCSVSCTGGPPFTISDAGGFGEFVQDLVLGTTVFFNLIATHNFAGGDADLLVLNLLNPATNFTLVDTNLDALSAPVPFQDALLVLNLANGQILTPTATTPLISVTAIPEPRGLLLLLAGGLLITGRIIPRRSHS